MAQVEIWVTTEKRVVTRRRLIRLMHQISQNLAHVRDAIDREIEERR